MPARGFTSRAAFYCAFASAAAILLSIAASQILLAMSFAALLLSGEKLRLPPIRLPLGLFLAGTLISLAVSGNPAAGLPQVRKIFVFLMLLVVYSTFRGPAHARRLFLCWAAVGALVALNALRQFFQKVHAAQALGRDFYAYYIERRITGFMSHWMTFGGEEMFVLIILTAFLLFGVWRRSQTVLWLGCAAVLSASLVLGMTRSIWLGSAAAVCWLVWFWKPRLVLTVPVILIAGALLAPASVHQRFVSLFRPAKNRDSNEHRVITFRTGLRMIAAHPFFGLGPEMVGPHFNEYLPPDVHPPLPEGFYGHLHNIYLQYAAERGIPVLLALLWLLARILFDFISAVRGLPPGRGDARFVLQGAIAVVIATMIAGCFEMNLGDSEVLAMFLAVVACGYTVA